MTIQPGQTYRATNPLDEGRRILIEAYTPGDARAHVVDADTGKRPRQILARTLHTKPTTKAGQPRRTGYVLETQPDGSSR
ncbi:hypothetical protein ACIRBY_23330 [Streptomyces sp. NPDC096136]|uniref:hypothetical protein n=1 Tax=Streptomyces sp. NPDC096136 TaxID=3366076 RepID=UPI00380C95AC